MKIYSYKLPEWDEEVKDRLRGIHGGIWNREGDKNLGVRGGAVGHPGVEVMMSRLKEQGWDWQGMRQDCQRFVKECVTCQKMKAVHRCVKTHPFTLSVHGIMDRMVVDTIGPLPADRWGNKYILTIVDSFSRWVELYALKNPTAEEAAQCLLQHIGRFGVPLQIQSDQGSQFVNELIERLVEGVGTEFIKSLAYSKEENGLCERMNKEVVRHLRTIVFDQNIKGMWSQSLPLVQRLLNTAKRKALGKLSSTEVMFGNNISLDRGIFLPLVEIEDPKWLGKTTRFSEWVDRMMCLQGLIIQRAKEAQKKHDDFEIQKRLEKREHEEHEVFEVEEFVLVTYPVQRESKLHAELRGPFRVVNISGNKASIQSLLTLKLEDVHITRLRKFHMGDIDPLEVAKRDKDEWTIDRVIRHNGYLNLKKTLDFWVKFEGLPDSINLWLPYSELRDNPKMHEYLYACDLGWLVPVEHRQAGRNHQRNQR